MSAALLRCKNTQKNNILKKNLSLQRHVAGTIFVKIPLKMLVYNELSYQYFIINS